MKRSRINLDDVANWETLRLAAYRAARGKHDRRQVQRFFAGFDREIFQLQREIVTGTVSVGDATSFQIFDPKPRIIHAPVFRERVLHHALIHHVGPVLDRVLVDDTFACRVGKGTWAAVRRAQQYSRRFSWYAKIDVRHFFASIDHTTLFGLIQRKFKNKPLLQLMRRIIGAHCSSPGIGLPIGALTSQHFANFYLHSFDRFLLNNSAVRGIVRYMDDTVFWTSSKNEAKAMVQAAREFLNDQLHLQLHPRVQINRSAQGIPVCGYRVFPSRVRLTRRRKHSYARGRVRWEGRFARGEISADELQNGYAAVLGIVLRCDSIAWRRNQLARQPPLAACDIA